MNNIYKISIGNVILVAIAILHTGNVFPENRIPLLNQNKDFRGGPEVVICTQNLHNFGTLSEMEKRSKTDKISRNIKIKGLIKRFSDSKCDIIAVQEIIGTKDAGRITALAELVKLLSKHTSKTYRYLIGDGVDKVSRLGFIYSPDTAKLISSISYRKVILPALMENSRPEFYLRAPLEARFMVKSSNNTPRIITLINMHLKSKRGGSRDPAKLDWEIDRMEMSEGIRRIILNRHSESLQNIQKPLIILGDRNSEEGIITLKDFRRDAKCRLSKRGVPLCVSPEVEPQLFRSVIVNDKELKYQGGTYYYRKDGMWIDDILLSVPSLPYALAGSISNDNYTVGLNRSYSEASDHALVWLQLNW
jgi:hypothetical protein